MDTTKNTDPNVSILAQQDIDASDIAVATEKLKSMPSFKRFKVSPYEKNFFCRNCSGGTVTGHKHWVPRSKVKSNPPRCPDCGSILRDKPVTNQVEGNIKLKTGGVAELYQLRLVKQK